MIAHTIHNGIRHSSARSTKSNNVSMAHFNSVSRLFRLRFVLPHNAFAYRLKCTTQFHFIPNPNQMARVLFLAPMTTETRDATIVKSLSSVCCVVCSTSILTNATRLFIYSSCARLTRYTIWFHIPFAVPSATRHTIPPTDNVDSLHTEWSISGAEALEHWTNM